MIKFLLAFRSPCKCESLPQHQCVYRNHLLAEPEECIEMRTGNDQQMLAWLLAVVIDERAARSGF